MRTRRPDLVLLDLHLPGHDRRERARMDCSRTPGRARFPSRCSAPTPPSPANARVLASGARAYLTKPLDVADVLRLVDDVLSGPPGKD